MFHTIDQSDPEPYRQRPTMAVSHSSSCLFSILISIAVLASMQIFRVQLGSTQLLTIAGGFLGSIIFVSLLTAISNFEMNIFGTHFQAKIFPEVFVCLIVSMICCAFIHRVCVSTCLIFSLISLYYINRISNKIYGTTSIQTTSNETKKMLSSKKKQM